MTLRRPQPASRLLCILGVVCLGCVDTQIETSRGVTIGDLGPIIDDTIEPNLTVSRMDANQASSGDSDTRNSTDGGSVKEGDSIQAADADADDTMDAGSAGSNGFPNGGDSGTQSNQCIIDEARCTELSQYWMGDAARYPIVLVHGFMGWDQRWWLDYFFDIPATLHQAGYSVFTAALDPVASSTIRSEQLLDFVNSVRRCSCAQKVNLIGHSQGGLDARMLVGPLNQAAHVASITTISSPHKGFSLADDVIAARGLGPAFLDALTVLAAGLFLGPSMVESDLLATLESMSIEARTQYNLDYPDPPNVPIYSYAGFTGPFSDGMPHCEAGEFEAPRRGDLVEPALLVLYGLLGGRQVPNDGVVPVSACIWGRFLGCIAADHWDQIGQAAGLTDQFDFRSFYRRHAQFLTDSGF